MSKNARRFSPLCLSAGSVAAAFAEQAEIFPVEIARFVCDNTLTLGGTVDQDATNAANGIVDPMGVITTVPFALMLWDDGLDHCEDEDGNDVAYFDDFPGYHPHAFYASRKSAEMAQCYLERDGIKGLMICEDYQAPAWELLDKPIQP